LLKSDRGAICAKVNGVLAATGEELHTLVGLATIGLEVEWKRSEAGRGGGEHRDGENADDGHHDE
jgi:hypothetical protein